MKTKKRNHNTYVTVRASACFSSLARQIKPNANVIKYNERQFGSSVFIDRSYKRILCGKQLGPHIRIESVVIGGVVVGQLFGTIASNERRPHLLLTTSFSVCNIKLLKHFHGTFKQCPMKFVPSYCQHNGVKNACMKKKKKKKERKKERTKNVDIIINSHHHMN